jgi:predicted TIM-barrel fold metal-dependent hydrolase
MGFVDAHSHVWTDEISRYPLAPGFSVARLQPRAFTPQTLLGHCRPSGVDRVVLIQVSHHGWDNSYLLDTIASQPEVFGGVAMVDHRSPDLEAQVVSLAARGIRGFRIRPGGERPDEWLEQEGMRRLWSICAEQGLAVCPLVDPDALGALERACGAFPRTPVVIDHMGRIGFAGPVREADVDALCSLAGHGGVRVKVSAFYGFGRKSPPHDDVSELIRRLHASYGSKRLMWGSDCPFQVLRHRYEDSIAVIRDRLRFLSDSDREWMLGRTAEEVFFP